MYLLGAFSADLEIVDPRVYLVSLYDIMNVVDEPDLFVCALVDFMKILYLETPTESGMRACL